MRRRVGERGLGFGAHIGKGEETKNELRALARTEDLIKFGMIPEFMGRLPIIVACDALDVDVLTEVLWKPKNALAKQYERLFEMEGVKLRFTEDALQGVAEEAHAPQVGRARPARDPRRGDARRDVRDPVADRRQRVRGHARGRRVAQPPAARAREESVVVVRVRLGSALESFCQDDRSLTTGPEASARLFLAHIPIRSLESPTKSTEDRIDAEPERKSPDSHRARGRAARLSKKGENALSYSMNHERNIGRDSIDESMEEELFSTEMRLHDREKFLLGKINKQLVRLDARRDRRLRGLRRGDLVPPAARAAR